MLKKPLTHSLPLLNSLVSLLETTTHTLLIYELRAKEKKLEAHFNRFFLRQGRIVSDAYTNTFVESTNDLFSGSDDLVTDLADVLEAYTLQVAVDAANDLAGTLALSLAFDLKNPKAVEYAKSNAASKIKDINQTSKDRIRELIAEGIDNGRSHQQIAKDIQKLFTNWGSSTLGVRSRSELIAINETGAAYQYGNYVAVSDASTTGLTFEKRWSTVGDDRVTKGCQDNQDQEWIDYNDPFKSGDLYPPRFPGCRCAAQYRRKGST